MTGIYSSMLPNIIGMLLRKTWRQGSIALRSPNNFMSLVRGKGWTSRDVEEIGGGCHDKCDASHLSPILYRGDVLHCVLVSLIGTIVALSWACWSLVWGLVWANTFGSVTFYVVMGPL